MFEAVPVRLPSLLTAILLSCAFSAAQTSPVSPAVNLIVAHMQQAKTSGGAGFFHVVRQYELAKGNTGEVTSTVVAQVEYDPQRAVQYSIQKASGSGRGEDVVKRILDREVSVSDSKAVAVTEDNYDFQFAGQDVFQGSPCYLLRLQPKRKDSGLIAGQAWIDQRTFQIRHLAGELVKSPSWWLKSVSVKITFDNLQGRWVQTATEAAADVRMAGIVTLKSQVLTFGDEQSTPVTELASDRSNRSRKNTIPAEVLFLPMHKQP
jgi:hypothetical protein